MGLVAVNAQTQEQKEKYAGFAEEMDFFPEYSWEPFEVVNE